jgi:hypothetical protein
MADNPFTDEQRGWLEEFTKVLGEKLVAFARRLDESLSEDRRTLYRMTMLHIRAMQKIGEDTAALTLALQANGVVTSEDIEGARHELRAGLAVDRAVDPELAEEAVELERRTRELEQELGIEPEHPEDDKP